ncbi:MAG: endonuclease/exonuclease/phosphatase family protein [Bacteroidota bacterium]
MLNQRPNLIKFGFLLLLTIFFSFPHIYAAEDPFSITVMTLNLHNGRDSVGRSNLDRFLELIAEKKPDIIALQEVERKHLKSFESAGYQIISGMNANLPFFMFGNVVLTKHKVLYHRHHYLPSRREQRGLNEVAVEIEGRYFRILNTHIGLGWAEQMQQLNEIKRIADYLKEPLLIIGDFNLEPSNKLLKDFQFQQVGAAFSLPKTFPTHNPRYQIDLIWYSRHWQPIEAEVIDWDGSDHFPVLSRLVLTEPHFIPLAKVEIPDLTKAYNPLLPDIGGTRYQLQAVETKNGNSEKINGGGTLYLNDILFKVESTTDQALFSIGVSRKLDLRDYASLWGVRGKAEWSLNVSGASGVDPWLTWEQYYRWNSRWGTRITGTNGPGPELKIEQIYLPREKIRYRLGMDSNHGYNLGIAFSPDKKQVFEISRFGDDQEHYLSLSWELYGFKP